MLQDKEDCGTCVILGPFSDREWSQGVPTEKEDEYIHCQDK